MKGLIGRWIAWKRIDDGAGGGAGSREGRVDAMLREAGAREIGEGAGRLRWRVLDVVSRSSVKTEQSDAAPGWIVGVVGRHGGWVAACVLVAAGVGLSWLSMRQGSGPSAGEGGGGGAMVVSGAEGSEAGLPNDRGGIAAFAKQAVTLGPTAAIVASIEKSYQQEKDRMLADARRMASAIAQRVTAPIAALHRGRGVGGGVEKEGGGVEGEGSRSGGEGGA